MACVSRTLKKIFNVKNLKNFENTKFSLCSPGSPKIKEKWNLVLKKWRRRRSSGPSVRPYPWPTTSFTVSPLRVSFELGLHAWAPVVSCFVRLGYIESVTESSRTSLGGIRGGKIGWKREFQPLFCVFGSVKNVLGLGIRFFSGYAENGAWEVNDLQLVSWKF